MTDVTQAVLTRTYMTDESGTVQTGNAGVVGKAGLPDGDTFKIVRAALVLSDGQPAPADLDLVLLTEDNTGKATLQTTILEGDGSTVKDRVVDNPVAEYTNNTGERVTVAVVVDNGSFGAGSGANRDIWVEYQAVIER